MTVGIVFFIWWYRTISKLMKKDIMWGLVAIYSSPFVLFVPFLTWVFLEISRKD